MFKNRRTSSQTSNSTTTSSTTFSIKDVFLAMTFSCLLLFASSLGRDLKNVWLIQFGTGLLGVAIWWPTLRHPNLFRLQRFCIILNWWTPVSWIASFAIWQSAFHREQFWIPQLMAIGDVAHVLIRFAIAPLSLAVLIIGTILYRRSPAWSIVALTIVGVAPLVLLPILETNGQVEW